MPYKVPWIPKVSTRANIAEEGKRTPTHSRRNPGFYSEVYPIKDKILFISLRVLDNGHRPEIDQHLDQQM